MTFDSVIKVSGLSSRKVGLGLLGSSVVSSKLQIRATVGALGFSVTENMATITKKELIGTKLFERWQKKKKHLVLEEHAVQRLFGESCDTQLTVREG